VRVAFPTQNFLGDYRFEAGPGIQDLLGQPMSQVYTGAFTITLPTISGMITNINGLALGGVAVQPSGGLQPAISDATGVYSVGVPFGWNGTLTPSAPNAMFVPGTRSFSNVQGVTNNQDFLSVPTIAPSLTADRNGTNYALGWSGIPGVTYQIYYSSNLTDWYLLAAPIYGSGPVQYVTPITDEAVKFFRVNAVN